MIREIYLFLKSTLDPLLWVLILLAIELWKLRFQDKSGKGGRRLIFASFILLMLFSLPITTQILAQSLQFDVAHSELPNEPLDAIVVLSAGLEISPKQPHLTLSTETAARFFYGVEFFKKNKARKLIFSGNTHPKISDTQIMKDLAISFGIPPDQIIMEDKARNTREHAFYVYQMLLDPKKKIGIVTSALHMPRSVKTFKRYFSEVYAFPSTSYADFDRSELPLYFFPQAKNFYLTTQFCREYIGLVWYEILQKQNLRPLK